MGGRDSRQAEQQNARREGVSSVLSSNSCVTNAGRACRRVNVYEFDKRVQCLVICGSIGATCTYPANSMRAPGRGSHPALLAEIATPAALVEHYPTGPPEPEALLRPPAPPQHTPLIPARQEQVG